MKSLSNEKRPTLAADWPRGGEIIATMKRLSGRKTDAELADFLDLSKVTIATWRKRDQVPMTQVVQFARRANLSVDSVLFPHPQQGSGSVDDEMVIGLALYVYDKVSGAILFGHAWKKSLTWGRLWPHLIRYVSESVRSKLNAGRVSAATAVSQVKEQVDRTDEAALVGSMFALTTASPKSVAPQTRRVRNRVRNRATSPVKR